MHMFSGLGRIEAIREGSIVTHEDLKGMWLPANFPTDAVSTLLYSRDKEIVRLKDLLRQRNKTIRQQKKMLKNDG